MNESQELVLVIIMGVVVFLYYFLTISDSAITLIKTLKKRIKGDK